MGSCGMCRALFKCIGFAILTSSPITMHAMSPDRAVIRLTCSSADGTVTQNQAANLCRHLVQALSTKLPKATFRIVPETEWAPLRASDASVAVDMAQTHATLAWQLGMQDKVSRQTEFHVNTTQSEAVQYKSMKALVASSTALVNALRAHLGTD